MSWAGLEAVSFADQTEGGAKSIKPTRNRIFVDNLDPSLVGHCEEPECATVVVVSRRLTVSRHILCDSCDGPSQEHPECAGSSCLSQTGLKKTQKAYGAISIGYGGWEIPQVGRLEGTEGRRVSDVETACCVPICSGSPSIVAGEVGDNQRQFALNLTTRFVAFAAPATG